MAEPRRDRSELIVLSADALRGLPPRQGLKTLGAQASHVRQHLLDLLHWSEHPKHKIASAPRQTPRLFLESRPSPWDEGAGVEHEEGFSVS